MYIVSSSSLARSAYEGSLFLAAPVVINSARPFRLLLLGSAGLSINIILVGVVLVRNNVLFVCAILRTGLQGRSNLAGILRSNKHPYCAGFFRACDLRRFYAGEDLRRIARHLWWQRGFSEMVRIIDIGIIIIYCRRLVMYLWWLCRSDEGVYKWRGGWCDSPLVKVRLPANRYVSKLQLYIIWRWSLIS